MPLRILALGSSTLWCGAALFVRDGGGERIACEHELAGNEHSRRLLPMARALLDAAGVAWTDLHAIAFDAGPGSFTGIRIGCGVAQGLAFALGLPVLPVPSLDAVAWGCPAPRALAAIDARMGEVYFAEYATDGPAPVRSGAFRVLPAADAASELAALGVRGAAAGEAVGLGDAFERHPELARAMRAHGMRVDARAFPRADSIAAIAALRFDAGQAVAAEDAGPVYVRDKVALDVDEQRRVREARARGAAA